MDNAAGNKLLGQIHGEPRWGPGRNPAAKALELDGVNNWVECADSSGLDFRRGVAVSAWFKVRSFDCPVQTLIAKGEGWRLQRQAEKGTIEFALAGPAGTKRNRSAMVASKRAVDDGQWHHVLTSYDGKRVVLYLDGVEEDAVTAGGMITLNSAALALGENDASRGRRFNGWLSDVRIYDRGLSADEIKPLCQKGQP